MSKALEKLKQSEQRFTSYPFYENDGGDIIKLGEVIVPQVQYGRIDEPIQINIRSRETMDATEVEFLNLDSLFIRPTISANVLEAVVERCRELVEEIKSKYGDADNG